MSFPAERLQKWVLQIKGDLTEDGPIARLELYHTVDGEGGERLRVWHAAECGDADADELAQEVWDAAESDAHTHSPGMHQRYVVHAYRDKEDEPDNVCSFNLTSALKNNLLGDSDSPTTRGERGQQMRHTEALHRMLMQLTEVTAGRMSRDLEATRKRADNAETQVRQLYEMQQNLLDRSHERQLEMAKETQNARRMDKFLGLMMSMTPLILSKVLAGGMPISAAMPASAARDTSVKKLLGSLSEQELMGALEKLTPQNQLAFMELYQSFREDAAKEEHQKPEALRHGSQEKEQEASN